MARHRAGAHCPQGGWGQSRIAGGPSFADAGPMQTHRRDGSSSRRAIARWLRRNHNEVILALSWLAVATLGISCLAFVVVILSMPAVMSGGGSWVPGWAQAAEATVIATGLLAVATLFLMVLWRGEHDHGWPTVVLMLISCCWFGLFGWRFLAM